MVHTALFTHADCLNHLTPAGHPESPARLSAVLEGLRGAEFGALSWRDAPLGRDVDVLRVHDGDYGAALARACPEDGGKPVALDADTYLSAGSLQAARRGVGAVIAGVDGVMGGEFEAAFCATRPPGHHAEPDKAMGFCIWNQAAIGALYARAAYGLKRVAVVDFDVHHGNGSQSVAETDPDFFYGSIHEGGIYPGSGQAHEVAFGNLVNVPLPAHTSSAVWRAAFETGILRPLSQFAPDFVVLSAGFDGHRHDPLANFDLDAEDFAWATTQLLRITDGKLVSTLEGGYHLGSLVQSAQAHVRALLTYDRSAGGATSFG
ncbi:MAG: hypothetical protein RLZZ157_1759 [Pseudomonadota bacterium]|jgi:acetoin utilization deacetylase AcuC-like enzyme